MLARKRRSDGSLALWVELPDGKRKSIPAAWTSWEAPADDAPRTQGRMADYHALQKLVQVLEDAHGGEGGSGELAGVSAGAAGTRGAAGAVEQLSGGGARVLKKHGKIEVLLDHSMRVKRRPA